MQRPVRTLPALLTILLLLLQLPAGAETLHTTTLQLNYRQAEDVVSQIKPFIHPQGSISGTGYTIIIKTSEKNLQDIKQLIAEIDVLQRELMVSVAVGAPPAGDSAGGEDGDKHYGTEPLDQSRVSRVRVTEGKWATINTGESLPVGKRIRNPDGTVTETIVYQKVESGFRVLPRLHQQRVTLYVKPFGKRLTASGGKIATREAETTLGGKQGEWLLLGGTGRVEVTQPGSRVYGTQDLEQGGNNLYIKVDIIKE